MKHSRAVLNETRALAIGAGQNEAITRERVGALEARVATLEQVLSLGILGRGLWGRLKWLLLGR